MSRSVNGLYGPSFSRSYVAFNRPAARALSKKRLLESLHLIANHPAAPARTRPAATI